MSWSFNKLEKPITISYTPGDPGVPYDPGHPGSPGYTYYEEETFFSGIRITTLAPTGYDNPIYINGVLVGGGNGYRYFDGEGDPPAQVKGTVTNIQELGATVFYTYTLESYTVRTYITVPPVDPILPTPGVPPTPSQLTENYNLGWNAGARGPSPIPEGNVLSWRFSAGNVGSVVGLSSASRPQDQGYLDMALSVMATSGVYVIRDGTNTVTSPATFTDNSQFAIHFLENDQVVVSVNGAPVYETTLTAEVIADSSLYSGGDVIWDADQAVASGNAPLLQEVGAATVSNAAAVEGLVYAEKTFGPGTHLGVMAAVSPTDVGISYFTMGGEVNAFGAAVTQTDAVGNGYREVTLGPSTDLGVVAAVTQTDAQATLISENFGTADVSFQPLSGSGSEPGVMVGWTGDYVGDSLVMEPMTGGGSIGEVAPSIGVASCVFVQPTADASAVNGHVSTSSDMEMAGMIGLGADYDYALGYSYIAPLLVYSSDEVVVAGGQALLSFSVTIDAIGHELRPNSATLRYRNQASLEGYGGGQANVSALFSLEATGTGANVGVFEGVIGYA